MLYTPHFLTGAAILKIVPNPMAGLPLAFLSHILLDLLPHYDFDITPGFRRGDLFKMEKGTRYLFIISYMTDLLFLTISFIWLILIKKNLLLMAGGVVAILPDVIDQAAVALDYKLPAWQNRFQRKVSVKYGFITYPVVVLIALYFLAI